MSLDIILQNDVCQCCQRDGEVHWQNITHNLVPMAREAEIYEVLWHPERNGITYARQLITPLAGAIRLMEADPALFRAYDAPNGWGTLGAFLPWLKELLDACKRMPNARVEVST